MSAKKKVSLVEINVFEKMIPLVSGYLESYARRDSFIDHSFRFNKYSSNTKVPFETLLKDLVEQDSDIYAFSCYLWNTKLIRELVPALRSEKPDSYILMGGPQVMQQAEVHLRPECEKTLICNGEGEQSFAGFLNEIGGGTPDFANVNGLSFFRDGDLITNEPQERIKELDSIPSPFLNGVFEDHYLMTVYETNRGCPFHCSFCFWGAATNDRLHKFSEERIRDELSWLSRNGVPFIFIADANWGILKRDIEFSEHIAECKKENASPVFVYFSAAKNSPQRVSEITQVFTTSGLLNAQPISMQTLDETSLEYIDRKNIKLGAYEDLQDDLNERGISSFIELMFPLPGETLESFMLGLQKLFEMKASVLVIYPHLLLLNTPLYEQRKQHGLITRKVEDGASEGNLIVGTATIDNEEYKDGMRFIYAVMALFNTKSLHRLTYYLQEKGIEEFRNFIFGFVEHSKENTGKYSEFVEHSIETAEYYDITNYPMTYHCVLHEDRRGFDHSLYNYVRKKPYWKDRFVRGLFELDILSKTYIYSNTDVEVPEFPLSELKVASKSDRSILIELDAALASEAGLAAKSGCAVRVSIDHERAQLDYRAEQPLRSRADYCYGSIMRISELQPIIDVEEILAHSA